MISRFEALSSEAVLAPAMALLPAKPCRVLDVGAGTGRDAAWLAARGHDVVAVEPVAELRNAGMALHPSPRIIWLDDHLPEVAALVRRGGMYDLILVVAVWQHLRPEQHARAIARLAAMTAANGRLILSLREGPGSPARPCYPACPARIVEAAEKAGLTTSCAAPRRRFNGRTGMPASSGIGWASKERAPTAPSWIDRRNMSHRYCAAGRG